LYEERKKAFTLSFIHFPTLKFIEKKKKRLTSSSSFLLIIGNKHTLKKEREKKKCNKRISIDKFKEKEKKC